MIFAVVTNRPCALVVTAGRVTAVHPPYMSDGWLNKDARVIWRRLPAAGRRWSAGVLPYSPAGDVHSHPVRRWWHDHCTAALERELTLGRTGDGGWYVHESSNALVGWRYRNLPDALAECAYRITGSAGWERVPANYDRDMQPVEDEPLEATLR